MLDLTKTVEPNIQAMDDVLGRVLSATGKGSLAAGAKTKYLRNLAGSNEDIATLDSTRNFITVELGRIMSGTQRLPVMLLGMIQGTVPADTNQIKTARRELQVIRGDVRNRQLSLMGLPTKPILNVPDSMKTQAAPLPAWAEQYRR